MSLFPYLVEIPLSISCRKPFRYPGGSLEWVLGCPLVYPVAISCTSLVSWCVVECFLLKPNCSFWVPSCYVGLLDSVLADCFIDF